MYIIKEEHMDDSIKYLAWGLGDMIDWDNIQILDSAHNQKGLIFYFYLDISTDDGKTKEKNFILLRYVLKIWYSSLAKISPKMRSLDDLHSFSYHSS